MRQLYHTAALAATTRCGYLKSVSGSGADGLTSRFPGGCPKGFSSAVRRTLPRAYAAAHPDYDALDMRRES